MAKCQNPALIIFIRQTNTSLIILELMGCGLAMLRIRDVKIISTILYLTACKANPRSSLSCGPDYSLIHPYSQHNQPSCLTKPPLR